MNRTFSTAAFIIFVSLVAGYGCSSGLSIEDLPLYPGATEGEDLENDGFIGGEFAQYTTTDPYDKVLDFYTEALAVYETEKKTQTSELGRQIGITIPRRAGALAVVIQEFTEEGTVNITFMDVGL